MTTIPLTDRAILLRSEDDVAIAKRELTKGSFLSDGAVTIENVASRCIATDVAIDVPGVGRVVGDIAYGGNWFFLTHVDGVAIELERAR